LENEPEAEDRAKDQGFSITDKAILKALEMMPFTSIRQIAKMIFIPPTTRFHRLMKSLHFALKR
jgi:DNA-binding Lrp family transcriptional regulator